MGVGDIDMASKPYVSYGLYPKSHTVMTGLVQHVHTMEDLINECIRAWEKDKDSYGMEDLVERMKEFRDD